MGPAAGELYFDFGISLSTTATASNNSHYFLRRRPGSIALPVPVIAAAIRLLPVNSYSSVVLQPAVFAVEGGRSIRVSAVPRVAEDASDEPWVERSLSMLWNPDSKGFGQVLGICDTITTTTTTTCAFELHRSDKESLKVTDFKPIYVLCFG